MTVQTFADVLDAARVAEGGIRPGPRDTTKTKYATHFANAMAVLIANALRQRFAEVKRDVDRSNAAARRAAALKGVPRVSGMDRDEYPPAVALEGGEGASVRVIPRCDNRGCGASMGNQLRGLPDGEVVRLEVVE